jgi:adenosylmethionine-8-amino-7-oxononanoate aminotransferase
VVAARRRSHYIMHDEPNALRHVWMPYTQMKSAPSPVLVEATDGVYMILADGTRLIDGLASWWTACHGYNHPHIREAVKTQLGRMPHVMFGGIVHEGAIRLATRLAAILPGDLDHVFFSDSGSVSVEVAMKMAVQYWLNQGVPRRTRFVCFRHAYHGDTVGAMSLCDPVNSMHSHFKGFLLEEFPTDIPCSGVESHHLQTLLSEKHDEIAAVIIEPLVQGAGGMKFHSPESLAIIRQLCDQHRLLMIADEIATGFGRTGTMFACEQAGVVPDIICVGKALTAGTMGMAATIATNRVWDAFYSDNPEQALMHGPTFMANPLACAAANASLDLFESEPRLEQVRDIETGLREALRSCEGLPGVVDVRSKGAVGVVQVERLHSLERLRNRFLENGVWVRPFADIIYVTPPLTITRTELEKLCDAVVRVVAEWSRW